MNLFFDYEHAEESWQYILDLSFRSLNRYEGKRKAPYAYYDT